MFSTEYERSMLEVRLDLQPLLRTPLSGMLRRGVRLLVACCMLSAWFPPRPWRRSSFEMSASFYQTTRRHIPVNSTLHDGSDYELREWVLKQRTCLQTRRNCLCQYSSLTDNNISVIRNENNLRNKFLSCDLSVPIVFMGVCLNLWNVTKLRKSTVHFRISRMDGKYISSDKQ
jgi:hypothetical protein